MTSYVSRITSELSVCIFLLVLLGQPGSATAEQGAKNVILMIGDGMGFNHVDASSLYQYGSTGRQIYEQFPVRLAVSTYPEGGSYDPAFAWSDFGYVKKGVTDSAAAATALAAGVKTFDGAICVTKDEQGNVVCPKTVLERAEELGKATGVITNVQFSHATPAAFVAHNPDRGKYEEIAREMLLQSPTDVIMGAGHPCFDRVGGRRATCDNFKFVGGEPVWEGLRAASLGGDADRDGDDDPWVLVQDRASFQNMVRGPTPKRVLGVAPVHKTLQQERGGDGKAAPYDAPPLESVPTLVEMTQAALNVLDDDPEGFFLMVEGGAIDWASHKKQSGRMVEEQIAFNRAVEAVVEWVEQNSSWNETLVIVTADHETGYLLGPGSNPGWEPLVNNGPNRLPGMSWHHGDHTNSLVPLYAKGHGAKLFRRYADEIDVKRGPYVDNTKIGQLMFEVLR